MHRETAIGVAIEVIGNGTGIGLQMTGVTSPMLGWIIIVVSNAVGFFLIGHSLGKPETVDRQSTVSTVTLRPKKRLDASHNVALWEVEQHMEDIHGHSDHDGLEADVLDGVLVSDLMKRNCTRCGKRRNQMGDFVL